MWLNKPELINPKEAEQKNEASGKTIRKVGRPATRLKLSPQMDKSQYQSVDKIVVERFKQCASEVNFRQGAKGQMSGRFMNLKVVRLHLMA